MLNNKFLLIPLMTVLFLSACGGGASLEPRITAQPLLITQVIVESTGQQVTETSAPVPQETHAPTFTTVPDTPTPTPEPFLPAGLVQIGVDSINSLQQIGVIPAKEVYKLAFSGSGNLLSTLSMRSQDRSKYMEVWDISSGERIFTVDQLESPWEMFFSPDERLLYLFSANHGIDFYDLQMGEVVSTVELDADWADISPDGSYVAAGNYQVDTDESIIWFTDLQTEAELTSLTQPGIVMSLQISPDGLHLAGGFQVGNHFRDYVWEIEVQEIVADFIDYEHGITFSPDSSTVVTTKDRKLYRYSTEGWGMLSSQVFADPNSNVKPKEFSPAGEILAVEDRYDVVFLDSITGEKLFILPDECEVRFSQNHAILVTWCYQGDINVWGVAP